MLRSLVLPLGALALVALFPMSGATFYVELTTKIMIMAIFALSLDLLVGWTGLVSFGHAAYFGVGAYTLALLTPKAAAAGLWTTPSDLARFAIAVQDSLVGRSNPIISQALAREMLTRQIDNDGLGVFIAGKNKARRFEHSGRNAGFETLLVAYQDVGQGAVIMINIYDTSKLLPQIMSAIAEAYGWESYPRFQPAKAAE